MAVIEFLPMILITLVVLGGFFWLWMLIECATKEPREGNDKIVWILIILLTSLLGAVLYFFVRRPTRLRLDIPDDQADHPDAHRRIERVSLIGLILTVLIGGSFGFFIIPVNKPLFVEVGDELPAITGLALHPAFVPTLTVIFLGIFSTGMIMGRRRNGRVVGWIGLIGLLLWGLWLCVAMYAPVMVFGRAL